MFRSGVFKFANGLVLIGAVFGIILSLFGLLTLWTVKPKVTAAITDATQLVTQTLDATDGMLTVTSGSLDKAATDLTLMHTILTDTSDTIGQSTLMVDETAKLMGESMPQFVKNTQDALTSTQTTAKFVDDTLGAISSIPFIGGSLTSQYTPTVPLSQSIGQVKASLDPLNDSFSKLKSDLQVTSASMATVKSEVSSLSDQVKNIEASLKDAQTKVKEYQQLLANAHNRFDALQKRLPAWLDGMYIAISALLAWIAVSQLGAFLQAVVLITGQNEKNL